MSGNPATSSIDPPSTCPSSSTVAMKTAWIGGATGCSAKTPAATNAAREMGLLSTAAGLVGGSVGVSVGGGTVSVSVSVGLSVGLSGRALGRTLGRALGGELGLALGGTLCKGRGGSRRRFAGLADQRHSTVRAARPGEPAGAIEPVSRRIEHLLWLTVGADHHLGPLAVGTPGGELEHLEIWRQRGEALVPLPVHEWAGAVLVDQVQVDSVGRRCGSERSPWIW